MKWVTRERPKTDRIACPWLIRRFIDSNAEIVYVPADQVLEVSEHAGAHSFDAPGAEYTHRGSKCSFETLIDEFHLGADPALVRLAQIVHAADVSGGRRLRPSGSWTRGDRCGRPGCRGRRPPPARTRLLRLRRVVRVVPARREPVGRRSQGVRPHRGCSAARSRSSDRAVAWPLRGRTDRGPHPTSIRRGPRGRWLAQVRLEVTGLEAWGRFVAEPDLCI